MSLPVGRAVRAFTELMGQPAPDKLTPISPERWEMRTDLIAEEAKELDEAYEAGDDAAFLDACVDLVYVVIGLAVERGMPFDAAFEAVHRANMTKATTCSDCQRQGSTVERVGGEKQWVKCPKCKGRGVVVKYRDDGKVLKPEGWQSPDIEAVLDRAGVR